MKHVDPLEMDKLMEKIKKAEKEAMEAKMEAVKVKEQIFLFSTGISKVVELISWH
jgi:hypothetical protein